MLNFPNSHVVCNPGHFSRYKQPFNICTPFCSICFFYFISDENKEESGNGHI